MMINQNFGERKPAHLIREGRNVSLPRGAWDLIDDMGRVMGISRSGVVAWSIYQTMKDEGADVDILAALNAEAEQ